CQRTSRAADKSQSQQSRFRNPVFVPDSSPFIHSKCYKCNKIDQDEITDCPVKILHSFFPFCISERPGNARTFRTILFFLFCWSSSQQVTHHGGVKCHRLYMIHFDLIQRIGGNVLSSLLQITDPAGVSVQVNDSLQSVRCQAAFTFLHSDPAQDFRERVLRENDFLLLRSI